MLFGVCSMLFYHIAFHLRGGDAFCALSHLHAFLFFKYRLTMIKSLSRRVSLALLTSIVLFLLLGAAFYYRDELPSTPTIQHTLSGLKDQLLVPEPEESTSIIEIPIASTAAVKHIPNIV
jgi:hypothetical protein